jgi:hypothetical protein
VMLAAPPVALRHRWRVTLAAHEARTIRVTNAGRLPPSSTSFPLASHSGCAGNRRSRRAAAGNGSASDRGGWRSTREKPHRSPSPPGPRPRGAWRPRGARALADRYRRAVGVVGRTIGIVVVVRVPGLIVHRLRLQGARLRRGVVELAFRNAGNVSERLGPGRVRVVLLRHGRIVARLRVAPRDVLTRATAIARWPTAGRSADG